MALDNLEDKLVEVQTHPDLVTLILLAVDGKMTVLKETPIKNGEDMANLMRQQDDIGLHMVKYGILILEWARVQTKWTQLISGGHTEIRPGQWTKILQDSLWSYVMEMWEYPNKRVHGSTEEEV